MCQNRTRAKLGSAFRGKISQFSQPANQPSQPGWLVGWLAGLAGWLAGWLGWLSGLVGWPGWAGWLVGCLGWLAGWLDWLYFYLIGFWGHGRGEFCSILGVQDHLGELVNLELQSCRLM